MRPGNGLVIYAGELGTLVNVGAKMLQDKMSGQSLLLFWLDLRDCSLLLIIHLVLTQETPASMRLMEHKNPYIQRGDKMDFRNMEAVKQLSSPLFLSSGTPRCLHITNTEDKAKSASKDMLFSNYWKYSCIFIFFSVPLRIWQPHPESLLIIIHIFCCSNYIN